MNARTSNPIARAIGQQVEASYYDPGQYVVPSSNGVDAYTVLVSIDPDGDYGFRCDCRGGRFHLDATGSSRCKHAGAVLLRLAALPSERLAIVPAIRVAA